MIGTQALASLRPCVVGCVQNAGLNHEPAGYRCPFNQEVWHYHVHVLPRYAGDRLYQTGPLPDLVPAERRLRYVVLFRGRAG